MNMAFVNACRSRKIIPAILPPHSTHQLQPLDAGIFSPLATAYSNQIDQAVQSNHSFSRITRRNFCSVFKITWETALTTNNICSAFAATSVHPLQPTKILSQLRPKTPPQLVESGFRTPGSLRAVRRFIKTVTASQTELNTQLDTAMRALEKIVS